MPKFAGVIDIRILREVIEVMKSADMTGIFIPNTLN